MDDQQPIIRMFTRILEQADTFRHGHEESFAEVSLSEVHCIDRIGAIDHANVTKVADELEMTRGGVSKIVKRLRDRGYIESYQEPENRKEVYFRLTEKGERLYAEHRQCHIRVYQERARILEAYSPEERAVIYRFLDEMRQWMDRESETDE
ncbi:MarR family winged helix-turn-helix transcriptional regulator [Pseudodesulfovibrio sp.]|uniref:MarR family winged helix-turn-helix transcriptional regulator n=1 Tax=unclassified Pseudodesulfovibrio TaxID=2661612 RepID=UPI003B00644B